MNWLSFSLGWFSAMILMFFLTVSPSEVVPNLTAWIRLFGI